MQTEERKNMASEIVSEKRDLSVTNGYGALRPTPAVSAEYSYVAPSYLCDVSLKLDSNEGAEPSDTVIKKLTEIESQTLRCYPKLSRLENKIAKKLEILPKKVMVSAGGDDALDRACRAVLGQDDEIILPVPTFEMIEQYASITGAVIKKVDWSDNTFPLDAIIESVTSKTKMIAVVTPNNPTGAIATRKDIIALSEAAPHALILVDLAYCEFAEEDLTSVVLDLPNAVAIRTLSKAWGLAGLRVGFAVGNEEILNWMRATTGPYMMSGVSLELALCALDEDDNVNDYISRIKEERGWLSNILCELGARPLPSQANFVLAEFDNALQVWQGLIGLGIAVRHFGNRPELKNYLRITCPGKPASFRRLVRGLKRVVAPEAVIICSEALVSDKKFMEKLSSRFKLETLGQQSQITANVIEKTLENLGVEKAWMVCSTPAEIQSAREALVVPVGIVPQVKNGEDLEVVKKSLLKSGAAWVLNDITELKGLLNCE